MKWKGQELKSHFRCWYAENILYNRFISHRTHQDDNLKNDTKAEYLHSRSRLQRDQLKYTERCPSKRKKMRYADTAL